MAGLSPHAYRRDAGYRRSEAPRPVRGAKPTGPVRAFDVLSLDSPVLQEFMRGSHGVGGPVNDNLALRNSTFFRGFNLIVSSIAMLPTFLMRRTVDKNGAETIEKAKDHPLYRLLKKRPNSFQTAFEFKAHMQGIALFDGNAYAIKVPGVGGVIQQLVPLARGSVTPKLSDTWQLTFDYRRPNGTVVTLKDSDIFHFRHPVTRDGVKGISLVDMAVNALGVAAQAEKAASKILSTGMIAGGALETSATLGEEAINQLKSSMAERRVDGDAAGDWLVLEEGLTAKPFTNAKDNQYDEMRQRQAEEIARIFGVPRPLLMFDETSWGSGIEQLGQYFVLYCLMPWMIAWEQAVERSCLTQAEQDADELYVKFNEGALIRGSLKDQADFFKAALGPNQAYRSVNEVRSAFDLNPKTGSETGPDAVPAPTSGPAVIPTEDPKK